MSKGSARVIYWAIAANVAIAIAKFAAAGITQSSAMLSEGIHALVDTGDGVLLLIGTRLATEPPDARHPYGHGRELYFWSFVVAVCIFAIGGGISIFQGVHRLRAPEPLRTPIASYVVLAVSFLFDGGSFAISWRYFRQRKREGLSFVTSVRRSKDPSEFMIVFEDGAALVGDMIAGAAITLQLWTGRTGFDGGGSIVIGAMLAMIAAFIANETRSLLVGEGLSPRMKDAIRGIVEADDAVAWAGDPLGSFLGPETVLVNLSIRFRSDLSMAGLEDAVGRIEAKIREKFPVVKHVFIDAAALRRVASTSSE